MRAGESGVAAEIDLAAEGEPAQIVAIMVAYQEGGLGMVHLNGDRLHPNDGRWGGEHTDAGRIAAVGLGGEGVDDGDG